MVTATLARQLRVARSVSTRIATTTTRRPASSSLRFFSSAPSADQAAADDDATAAQKLASTAAPFVGREDFKMEEQKRRRLSDVPISDVLKAKHSFRWVDPVIHRNATVRETITACIDGGLSGMMVVESQQDKHVVGLATSRDLLRIMAAGLKDDQGADEIMNQTVGNFMSPISQVIFARPDETIGMCRTIMAKLGIKCIPILSREGRVEGLITARDMSDYGLEAEDRGGKKNYLRDISERVGLSSNTSMAEPPPYLQAHLALEQSPLWANVGVAELPHPFKTEHGIGANRRDYGADELSTNPDYSEDAYFATTVTLPDEKAGIDRDVTYLGVADGVGSWREYGVDPRLFSHKLMEECHNILHEASFTKRKDGEKFRRMVAPAEMLSQAYERVKAENIIGSTTACVALFDNIRHQLHFSNLGDSGLIVLRHIDSDIAGSLKRDKTKPRSERKSDLRVAFVSQQQLHSFNHPYQLGWTGKELGEDETKSFKTAADSCTTSLHVRRGDIIIMATDGLFDNVDVDDICATALAWEQKCGFIRDRDIIAREQRWAMGNSLTGISAETIEDLAKDLTVLAREQSLNNDIDSPFAILAKENDIMWSGGMPDDVTVVCLHVVGRSPDDVMDKGGQ